MLETKISNYKDYLLELQEQKDSYESLAKDIYSRSHRLACSPNFSPFVERVFVEVNKLVHIETIIVAMSIVPATSYRSILRHA